MASTTSEERTAEKENNGTAEKENSGRKDSYVKWTARLTEYEKNRPIDFWGMEDSMSAVWNYDEMEMEKLPCANSKKLDDIHDHILNHGDGEEVVWEYDVWGLQLYTQIPSEQHQNRGRVD
ncbi:hypothetical protein ACH5RR_018673 [Cinchona calisaya]|uniref:Uncharacterized protein n=1 Tax=Cinchona calisaya TaxID=153742 RepID=A0ABD2ZMK8_9GENT